MALGRCVYSQCEGIAQTHHSSYISWGSITPYINLSQPADRLPIKSWLSGSMELCGRGKQAGYVVYWRCVHLRAGKGIQLLEGGEGKVGAGDRNWRIGGWLRIGKRGRGFSGFAPLHYNTVSLPLPRCDFSYRNANYMSQDSARYISISLIRERF